MNILTKKFFILGALCLLARLLPAQKNFQSLEYVENKGQWDSRVTFKSDLDAGNFYLRKTGFTVVQHSVKDLESLAKYLHGDSPAAPAGATTVNTRSKGKNLNPDDGNAGGDGAMIVHSNAYEVNFVNGNASPEIVAEKELPSYNNYFIGNDSTQWRSNVKMYQTVLYRNVYPNIDIRYYSYNGWLKYEFIVNPGGNPADILMRFDGVDKVSRTKNNELNIETSVGSVRELEPYTYQFDGNTKKDITCKYVVNGKDVRFSLPAYNSKSTLVIDPTLIFASLARSTVDNWGYTATYGRDGSLYGGGIVFGSGFPTSTGAFQRNFSGGNGQFDMGIIKLSANGTQRLYATYIGGPGKNQPHSLVEDANGNLVVAGRTNSDGYPLFPSTNRYGPQGGWDIVVTKLNPSGTALIGSARIGGNQNDGVNVSDERGIGNKATVNFYGDDARSEVILDRSGNIFVASSTQSANFFTTPNAAQKSLVGEQDAVLLRFTPNVGSLVYSSYFGGNGYDAGFVLAIDQGAQNIMMAGATTSSDIPGDKTGVIQPSYAGGSSDGYIAVFSLATNALLKSTYLGTGSTDAIMGIQFDKFNFPYVMGISTGTWPMTPGVYGQAGTCQFVGKLTENLSGWVFSTTFGAGTKMPNISPVAFLVDRCQNMYISGWGGDIEKKYQMSGTRGMPVTPDAIKSNTDNQDFYFIVIKRNASGLLYGTFFGQNGELGEHVDGGTSRYDQNGTIYQGICANCYGNEKNTRWPTTPGAWCCSTGKSPTTSGGQCNLGMVKIAFNFAGVASGVRPYIDNVFDSTGCVPLDVLFKDTVRNAQSYIWDFGDGSAQVPTKQSQINHVYLSVGDYTVTLVAIDSTTCNIRDTSYVTMRVRNDKANLGFASFKTDPNNCQSLGFTFRNTSTAPPNKPFGPKSFEWDFGDNTPKIVTGTADVTHDYAAAGTYHVALTLIDTNYCNSPQTLDTLLNVSPLTKASFTVPAEACAPYDLEVDNTSLAATFIWDFGDGSPVSTSRNPKHVYTQPGTYVIRLQAFDPSTCNKQDQTQQTVVVRASPTANFTYSPTVPQENVPITFSNISSPDAVNFSWEFGDGDSLSTTSRADIVHEYNTTGTFHACLIAYNNIGCFDSLCAPVQAIAVPRIDMPNAFTPNGDARNNKIFVKGFAIAKMKWTIYNRWGQVVFVSASKSEGWDGKFKGVVQPMDVYGYTLDVEFTDGTRATKKGDITLIR